VRRWRRLRVAASFLLKSWGLPEVALNPGKKAGRSWGITDWLWMIAWQQPQPRCSVPR
jgi:hypothetical protein